MLLNTECAGQTRTDDRPASAKALTIARPSRGHRKPEKFFTVRPTPLTSHDGSHQFTVVLYLVVPSPSQALRLPTAS